MPFFVIKKGLVLLEWKYFPTPKILDPNKQDLPVLHDLQVGNGGHDCPQDQKASLGDQQNTPLRIPVN